MRRARKAIAGVGLAAIALVSGMGSVGADPATGDEVRALAAQAKTDPSALAQLRSIDEVDGQPVDIDAALGDATGPELDHRLDELAQPGAGPPVDPTDPAANRDAARRILDGRKYNPVEPPRPFEGVLETIGGWLETVFGPIVRPIGDVVGDVVRELLDGGAPTIGLALAVVILSAIVGVRLARRRASAEVHRRQRMVGAERHDDPGVLDRLAEEAERAGDLALAYRLRFRAGLLRLDAKGAITYRPSMTTSALARAVLSPRFAHLAADFDQVAYGRRPVGRDELDASRQEWRYVLEEAAR